VYVSKPNNTFFDLSLLEAMNLPVFVDIGWKDYYLQFITIEQDQTRKSYKYAMFFKLVRKKDIISITQTPNLYDTLRDEVTKNWPFREKLLTAINEIIEYKEQELDKWCSFSQYLSSPFPIIRNQEQLNAALSHLELEEALPLSDFKNRVEKAKKLKNLISEISRVFTYEWHYRILKAPTGLDIMFRGYVYNKLCSSSKQFKRLSKHDM
jgi:hypothetical protein